MFANMKFSMGKFRVNLEKIKLLHFKLVFLTILQKAILVAEQNSADDFSICI